MTGVRGLVDTRTGAFVLFATACERPDVGGSHFGG